MSNTASSDTSVASDTGIAAQGAGGNRDLTYVERVLANGQWVVTTLAAAAGFVVTKLGFDQIGKGDYAHWRELWLFVSVAAFTCGVVVLIVGVGRTTTTTRTRMGWLHSKEGATICRKIEADLWLLPGAAQDASDISDDGQLAGGNALQKFETQYAVLMAKQYKQATDFSEKERYQLLLLQQAHEAIMDTVVAERLEDSRSGAIWPILIGSLVAVLGATGFGYVTNQATRVADKLDKMVSAGQLVPKIESKLRIVVPNTPEADVKAQLTALGAKCDPTRTPVDVILIEVATPPSTKPSAESVMHVITLANEKCQVAQLWLPPRWLIPTPSDSQSTSSKSTTPPATGS
jgi:hypothetical protein